MVSQSVIDTAVTLGDRLADVQAIAMHPAIYSRALKANEIQFFKPSGNSLQIPTYKGMAVIVDDNLTTATAGVYVTIPFGPGAVGYAVAPPRTGVRPWLGIKPTFGPGTSVQSAGLFGFRYIMVMSYIVLKADSVAMCEA